MFPPLHSADYFANDSLRIADVILNGLSGKITVNGVSYDGLMPPMATLSDEDIAHVSTYILNSFGNQGGDITVQQVHQLRKKQ